MSLATSALSSAASPPPSQSEQRPSDRNGIAGAFEALHCGACQKEHAPLRCSRCKAVRYCSPACQGTAWKAHQLICKAPPFKGDALALSKLIEAQKLHRQKAYGLALRMAREGLADNPKNIKIIGPLFAQIVKSRFSLGQFNEDTVDAAWEALNVGLENVKTEARVYRCLSYCLIRLERYQEAYEAAEKGSAANPAAPEAASRTNANAQLYLKQAQSLYMEHSYKESMRIAEEGLAEGPLDKNILAELYLCLADSRFQLSMDHERTMEAVRVAIAAGLENRDQKARAHHCLARCLFHLGRVEEAFKADLEALDAKPQNQNLIILLHLDTASILAHKGDYGAAIAIAEEAIGLAKACAAKKPIEPALIPTLYYTVAISQLGLRRNEKAIEAAQAALAEKPEDQVLIKRLNLIIKAPEHYLKQSGQQ